MDVIRQMGALPLATRLRRLHERLLREGTRVYRDQKLKFEPRWFPVYSALLRRSPMAVTEVAREVGLTHPAVNQVAKAMQKAGLLISVRDRKDDRKRLLSLSRDGKRLSSQLAPIWDSFEQATIELMKETGVDLVDALDRVEQALDKTEMYDRIAACRRRRQLAAVEIIDYERQYKNYFRKFNYEWLRTYFTVEPEDKKVLNDPEGQVIKKGGQVLFARIKGKIVGTVALLRISETTVELSKLAVAEKAQGRQIGRRLVLAVIERARSLDAKEVVLLTHPKLVAACSLYRSMGFRAETAGPRHKAGYRRQSVVMKLDLSKLEV